MTHPGTPGSADALGRPAGPAAGRPPATGPVPGEEGPGDQREFSCFYREHFAGSSPISSTRARSAPGRGPRAGRDDHGVPAVAAITSPRAYVYKVAGRAFSSRLDALELPVGEVPEPTSVLPRPEEAEAWLQAQQVIAVLRALPPRQRQVLALTIDGWPPAEIAELLGIDPAAVRPT